MRGNGAVKPRYLRNHQSQLHQDSSGQDAALNGGPSCVGSD